MKSIVLETAPNDKKSKKKFINRIINIVSNDEAINNIFDKDMFITRSDKFYIIKFDDEDIGFIRLRDNVTFNAYFLDVGIKEKYRGQEYCKRALQELYFRAFDKYILVEVTDTNEQEFRIGGKLFRPISNVDGVTLLFMGSENKFAEFLVNTRVSDIKNYFDLQYIKSLSRKDSLTGKPYVKKR